MPPLSGPKARRIAPQHPLHGDEGQDDEAVHEGAERVLLPHHAAVEEREARRRHQQDQRRRGQHPGGVAGVDLGWARARPRGRCRRGVGLGRLRRGAAGAGGVGRSLGPRRRPHQDEHARATALITRTVRPLTTTYPPWRAPWGARCQSALSSRSPVRIRTAVSTGVMKIFPSPIFPVLAAPASTPATLSSEVVGHHDFHLDLREEVHRVLAAAIELGVALLTAEAPHLGHGHPDDPDAGEGLLHVVELERLDDGFDLFHVALPAGGNAPCVPLAESSWGRQKIRNVTARMRRSGEQGRAHGMGSRARNCLGARQARGS